MDKMKVIISGKVYDRTECDNLKQCADELLNGVESEHWMREYEKGFRDYIGVRCSAFCNSGSSALLLALAALELPKGSEVITCATCFPTTVNVIIQCGLIPVLVDCEPGTWNIDLNRVETALLNKSNNIRAIIVTHSLGNPVNMEEVARLSQFHNLKVIEDACDALGSVYKRQMVGTFGDLAAFSSYPAHQHSTEEGGMVVTNNPVLMKIVKSYRDWGRDCYCEPGHDNTCGKRFEGGADHKYIYSRIGYHLAGTNMQAALGCAQLKKLDQFVAQRLDNWEYLWGRLRDLPIRMPIVSRNSVPSWFGFAVGVEHRNNLARYLDSHKIGNRPLFAGNIIRQPAYKNVEYRVVGDLKNSDFVHDHVLYIGCWPGLTRDMLDYTIEKIHDYYK